VKECNTIRDLLEIGKASFSENNIQNPRLNIECILEYRLNIKRLDLHLHHDTVVNDGKYLHIQNDIDRRLKHEPLQYIVGSSGFYGLDLVVNKDCFIPRPETEVLVGHILEWCVKHPARDFHICDIGTGSGNIAISLANNIKNAHVSAVDISPETIRVVLKNVEKNCVSGSVQCIVGDVFSWCNDNTCFDIIVSNPPYIRPGEFATLPDEVAAYEPRRALTTKDDDGLEFYKRIIDKGLHYLRAGGLCAFEVGDEAQMRDVEKLFKKNGLYSNITAFKDYNELDRVIVAQKK